MKKEILEILNDKEYISGEKIGKKLNVSRTSVWKQINNLKKMGYVIESVKNKGYKIKSRPDIPLELEIKRNLNTEVIGRKIKYFKTLPSTNTYAKKNIEKNLNDGTIIISKVQTKGRGRKNRFWSSNKGGLWFSIVLYPDISPDRGIFITMSASISIYKAIKEKTGIDSEIKWPNDILINKKKLCGILTEFDAETDKINYAIVGIGINFDNDIKDSLKNIATSIKRESKKKISRVDFLKSIIENFDFYYSYVKKGEYDKIRKEWLKYSKIIGKKIKVTQNKESLIGIVEKVDKNGFLILNTKKEKIRILSGDIEYI